MVYSKALRDIVDQCLLRDYKRRPSIQDILALPDIKAKIKETGIETKDDHFDPNLLKRQRP